MNTITNSTISNMDIQLAPNHKPINPPTSAEKEPTYPVNNTTVLSNTMHLSISNVKLNVKHGHLPAMLGNVYDITVEMTLRDNESKNMDTFNRLSL